MQVAEATSLQGVVDEHAPSNGEVVLLPLPHPLSILETLTQGFVHAGLPTEL